MADQWMIKGSEYSNCNCAWGCPCQFNSPSTYGKCEAVASARIDDGHFGDTRLDGLQFVMLLAWPGEIADGNGRMQVIIDERADDAQFEAIRKISHGEDTNPGATHYYVFNSTMTEVLEPLRAPISLSIDVEARKGRLSVPGLIESTGSPIVDPNSGEEFDARIGLPGGFEYTLAYMGNGNSRVTAGISMELKDSYGQFNALHMNQDGVIR
jgi:hypothetical protein